jgi:hypothetical protein
MIAAFAVAALVAAVEPSPSPASAPSPTPTPRIIVLPSSAPTPLSSPTAGVDQFGAPLSPQKIYENARLAAYLRTYPRYLTYVIDVQSTAYSTHYHEGYRALLRTQDDALTVKQQPIYTTNKAPAPYGFTFFGLHKTGKPQDHIDPPFGVPLISATYDFGLAEAPVSRGDLGPREEAIQSLLGVPVIGHVAVSGADYAISLVGQESLDGVDVYHLKMRPLHQPDQYRLRELWVDARTFDVRKLVTQGIFPGGPAAHAMWTVAFIELHGWWFIRTESTPQTLRWGRKMFSPGTEYHGITYTFGDYAYPDLISTLEFSVPQISTNAIQF